MQAGAEPQSQNSGTVYQLGRLKGFFFVCICWLPWAEFAIANVFSLKLYLKAILSRTGVHLQNFHRAFSLAFKPYLACD
jgi:hypothetical protein